MMPPTVIQLGLELPNDALQLSIPEFSLLELGFERIDQRLSILCKFAARVPAHPLVASALILDESYQIGSRKVAKIHELLIVELSFVEVLFIVNPPAIRMRGRHGQ